MSSIPSTSSVQTALIIDVVKRMQQLMLFAMEARNQSYSPYSKFRVGACLLADDGISYYAGCNVECASYGKILDFAVAKSMKADDLRFVRRRDLRGADSHRQSSR